MVELLTASAPRIRQKAALALCNLTVATQGEVAWSKVVNRQTLEILLDQMFADTSIEYSEKETLTMAQLAALRNQLREQSHAKMLNDGALKRCLAGVAKLCSMQAAFALVPTKYLIVYSIYNL